MDREAPDDLGELYRHLSRRLEQIVRHDLGADDAVIEDACQFAWSRLVNHFGRIQRGAALTWLVRTAKREACRIIRSDGRDLTLDGDADVFPDPRPAPEEWALRLDTLRALPARQQRALWLHGFGLSYEEIARHEGCTRRTVERQLLRAKSRLRAAEL